MPTVVLKPANEHNSALPPQHLATTQELSWLVSRKAAAAVIFWGSRSSGVKSITRSNCCSNSVSDRFRRNIICYCLIIISRQAFAEQFAKRQQSC